MAFRLARRTGRHGRDRDAPGPRHAEHLRRRLPDPRAELPGRDRTRALAPIEAARHAWFLGIALILASGLFKLGLRDGRRADPADRPPRGAARLARRDRAGDHQLLAAPGHRGPAGRRAGRPGRHPGHPDGALGAAGPRPRGPGGRRGRLPGLLWHERARPGAGPGGRRRPAADGLAGGPPLADRRLAGLAPGRRGARRSTSCRWRSRSPWPRSSAGSTAPRAPRPPGTTIRPARSSPPMGWRRSPAGSSAGSSSRPPTSAIPPTRRWGPGPRTPWRRPCSSAGPGIFGYFDWIFYLIPKAVVFPILIFVGLEITAQSFHATPRRHYPGGRPGVRAGAGLPGPHHAEPGPPRARAGRFAGLRPQAQHWVQTVVILSGGFIVTSLLWATALAHLIDGQVRAASATVAPRRPVRPVRGHPFAPALEPDRRARRGGPPAESRGPLRRDVGPDALPLGRGLRRHGRHPGPDRPGRPPPRQAGRRGRALTAPIVEVEHALGSSPGIGYGICHMPLRRICDRPRLPRHRARDPRRCGDGHPEPGGRATDAGLGTPKSQAIRQFVKHLAHLANLARVMFVRATSVLLD